MNNVISVYSLSQAVTDGVLKIKGHFAGKPVVVTQAIEDDLQDQEQLELFTQFLYWQRDIQEQLPEEDRLFARMASNGQKVWIIDDGAAITLLYPRDY